MYINLPGGPKRQENRIFYCFEQVLSQLKLLCLNEFSVRFYWLCMSLPSAVADILIKRFPGFTMWRRGRSSESLY